MLSQYYRYMKTSDYKNTNKKLQKHEEEKIPTFDICQNKHFMLSFGHIFLFYFY